MELDCIIDKNDSSSSLLVGVVACFTNSTLLGSGLIPFSVIRTPQNGISFNLKKHFSWLSVRPIFIILFNTISRARSSSCTVGVAIIRSSWMMWVWSILVNISINTLILQRQPCCPLWDCKISLDGHHHEKLWHINFPLQGEVDEMLSENLIWRRLCYLPFSLLYLLLLE